MANQRTPTKILEMRGSYKAHPERRPKNEPKGDKWSNKKPPKMTAAEKKIWDELVDMSPPGVLERGDRWSVEMLVRLFTRYREARGIISVGEGTQLIRLLTEFGMSPVSRSKVIVKDKGDKKDGWEEA